MARQSTPNQVLVTKVIELINHLKEERVKKVNYYRYVREKLTPLGFKPFDIFATYQYVVGQTKGDWEASVKLAAHVARGKKVG